jgi:tripartite-type tricarboxylate transporter receptor subunit TctC
MASPDPLRYLTRVCYCVLKFVRNKLTFCTRRDLRRVNSEQIVGEDRSMNKREVICCAILLAISISGDIYAQPSTYPSKPVRIVVTVAPGGGVDLVGRIVAQKLTETIRQPFVVENRVGASGIIGTSYVAKSAPDGYTLMIGTQTNHAVIPVLYAKQVTYDGVRDFTPITTVASSPLFFVVNPAVPVRTVRDFIALAKKRPGELTFGAASGGTTHMAVELFKLTAGVSMLFVPYKGEGPALTDTIGGQLSFQFANMPTALPHVRTGKLRGIAVTGVQRVSSASEFPTVAESGLPGYQHATWWGLVGPAGLPREIVARLNSETARGLGDAAVKEKLEAIGVFAGTSTPEQFATLLASEAPRWAKVVRESGAKPEY